MGSTPQGDESPRPYGDILGKTISNELGSHGKPFVFAVIFDRLLGVAVPTVISGDRDCSGYH